MATPAQELPMDRSNSDTYLTSDEIARLEADYDAHRASKTEREPLDGEALWKWAWLHYLHPRRIDGGWSEISIQP